MPFPENPAKFRELFEDKNKWVAVYDATGKNPYPLRLTTTDTFLRKEIDEAICYASHKEKSFALKRVLDKEGDISATPALILWEMKKVKLFTD